jgi:uncharacterized membrane protein
MQLLNHLEELVRAGIITSDTAEQINRYYQSKKDSSGNKFNTLLGILGALLVSAGIVLVVAHNWDDLNKTIKTVFAFLPLVAGQGLCAYTLLKKKDSQLWRESSSVFLFFAVAAGIALVSQIYQISGPLPGFIFTWLLLTAPLVYIMKSSATSLLVIATASWYGYLAGYDFSDTGENPHWYFLLFLLFLVPHYYGYVRNRRHSLFFHFHNWFLVASLIINLQTFNLVLAFEWGFASYLALFSVFYLLGNLPFFSNFNIISNPFLVTGLLGSLLILLGWSFHFTWQDLWVSMERIGFTDITGLNYILVALLLMAVALTVYHYRQGIKTLPDPVGFSAFVFVACIILHQNFFSVFIINIWILLIGLYFIRRGGLQNHLGILNVGLLIILILAICRFFDDSIPFIWRGLFFVLAGAGFFAANYLMMRKRKAVTQNNNS